MAVAQRVEHLGEDEEEVHLIRLGSNLLAIVCRHGIPVDILLLEEAIA